MTNEEAIELLQGMLEGLAGGENILELKLTMGALDMAIKALQALCTNGCEYCEYTECPLAEKESEEEK